MNQTPRQKVSAPSANVLNNNSNWKSNTITPPPGMKKINHLNKLQMSSATERKSEQEQVMSPKANGYVKMPASPQIQKNSQIMNKGNANSQDSKHTENVLPKLRSD